jgi:lipopolysaccharide biosynthesis protein
MRRLVKQNILKSTHDGPTNTAVVTHVYYFEEYAFILEKLLNIPGPFDLFVTTPHSTIGLDSTISFLSQNCVSFNLFHVKNKGRDLLPFLQLVQSGSLDSYKFVLKLHTKRSPWLNGYSLPVKSVSGQEWFEKSIHSLIGDRDRVEEIQKLLAVSNTKHKMIAPYGSTLNLIDFMSANKEDFHRVLSGDLRINELSPSHQFASGSMYWINSSLVNAIKSLDIEDVDDLDEPIPNDGTSIHALERAIGYLASNERDGLEESEYFPLLTR